MRSDEIREAFLRFFEERGHRRVPSAPLVPPGDPTLLFTSAGMVQFKPYFMGQTKPPQPRLTSVQKCFRTSDIDSVGDTSHLTFFEMLGNFSVGDYFKAEAIPWAWEFVTDKKWLGLDPERLWAAVYLDDDEAFELWRKLLPEERIRRYGEEHNYWFSGEIGPCGPCSELHYDFGPEFGCGPDCEPNHDDCDRFLEIWNLVFMSYFRDGDKRDPLPSKNIDTGAGLERMAVASLFESEEWKDKSKLPSVYDTDLFTPIIKRIEKLSGKKYGKGEVTDRALRIVAEHARAVTFLIGDERTPVMPSNEERGYAVRRVLRRAVYFGRRYLGLEEPFLTDVAETTIEGMSGAYPELEGQRKFVLDILAPEEQRFEETLSRGLEMLEEALAKHGEAGEVPSEEAFLLHDTYGFPLELTVEIARERGFSVDEAGFEVEMEKQRERARAATKGAESVAAAQAYAALGDIETAFGGYDTLETQTTVRALFGERRDGASAPSKADLKVGPYEAVEAAEAPAEVELFLAETPFYPEGGGQVGDRGEIVAPNGRVAVEDTQTVAERLIVHRGRVVEGRIAVGDTVTARVDAQHRHDTMRNHTGTHLLNAALRSVLGAHVRQSGSLVAPDHLRFDFTHTESLTEEQSAEVQRLVNDKIRQDLPVETRQTGYDQAISEGVLAFFGEKYGEEVRVVEVSSAQTGAGTGVAPRFSAELCGGTHCRRTGEIGVLIITGESSIGAGVRRIEALTGRGAEGYVRTQTGILDEIARRLSVPRDRVLQKLDSFLAQEERHRKQIQQLTMAMAQNPEIGSAGYKHTEVDGVQIVTLTPNVPSVDGLRRFADSVRRQYPSAVVVLGTTVDDRPHFIVVVSPSLLSRGLNAVDILKGVATVVGGGGGGRPDMATGGGKDPAKLAEALKQVPDIVRKLLAGT